MKTNSNFFCLTPIFRVHSVLFFRVTKNRYKNRITIFKLYISKLRQEMKF